MTSREEADVIRDTCPKCSGRGWTDMVEDPNAPGGFRPVICERCADSEQPGQIRV